MTIKDCDESAEGDLEIPAEIEGLLVSRIGDEVFRECANFTSVTLPEGVTSIKSSAFAGCSSLTSITLRPPRSKSLVF